MKKSLAAFGLIIALAACADDKIQVTPYAPSMGSKISLDVHKITLADRSLTAGNSVYASNHFTPTLGEAVKQWAFDHLEAVGQDGDAIVIVKDSSLTAQPLATPGGIDSWFTRQQGSKYVAHVDVAIEANGAPGYAVAEASASRVLTLPENPSEAEKQDAYNTLLTGVMHDLQHNLESGIQSHLHRFVSHVPSYGTTAVPMTSGNM